MLGRRKPRAISALDVADGDLADDYADGLPFGEKRKRVVAAWSALPADRKGAFVFVFLLFCFFVVCFLFFLFFCNRSK